MKSEKITPHNKSVLAEVLVLPDEVDGVYIGEGAKVTKTDQAFYLGVAKKLGEMAADKDQCPGLKEGDGIVFSKIAGFQVKTDDVYCKVINGYDIVATVKDVKEGMRVENIKPAGDRVLVKVIGEELIEDGVYDSTRGEDPREGVTQKGIVISCGPEALNIEAGTIVAFDPFCGAPVVNDGEVFLKAINSFDILFSLSK